MKRQATLQSFFAKKQCNNSSGKELEPSESVDNVRASTSSIPCLASDEDPIRHKSVTSLIQFRLLQSNVERK